LIDLLQFVGYKRLLGVFLHKMRIIPRVEKETHVAKKSKYRGTREFELSQSSEIAGLFH